MKSFITCFFFISVASQAQNNIVIGIAAGLNFSDVNYGGEFFEEFLPKADYRQFQAAGEGAVGYYLEIGVAAKVSNHFSVIFDAGYNQLQYKVEASVSDFNPNTNRPLSTSIPASANGNIKYSFLSLQAGLAYALNEEAGKGLQITALLSNMIHVNTDWQLDVEFENGSSGESNDISELTEPDFNNLWLLGLDVAYGFPLSENLSISPKVGFRYGLNSLVDETLSPSLFQAGVGLQKWF